MTTYFDAPFVRPSAYNAPKALLDPQWPDKMLRTYLWTLGIQGAPSVLGYHSDETCSCDRGSFTPCSIPPSPTGRPLVPLCDMGYSSMSSDTCSYIDSIGHSKSPRLLVPSQLRHIASCEAGMRNSLPDSPRRPRLVSYRSSSEFMKHDEAMGHLLKTSAGLLEIPSDGSRRKRASFKPLPKLPNSSPPSIILSAPSSPCSTHTSFVSLLSSAPQSDYPSQPAYSSADDCESSRDSPESVLSTSSGDDQLDSTPRSSHIRFLDTDRKSEQVETYASHPTVWKGRSNEATRAEPAQTETGSLQEQPTRAVNCPGGRIVTVYGVDFEIASSPIAWDHGSFKE